MVRYNKFYSIIFLLSAFCFPLKSNADGIHVLSQPFPPFSIHLDNGQASGFGVEIFHILAKEIGLDKTQYHVIPKPFKRIYIELQRVSRHVGVAIGRTPQRENLFKWVGPYTNISIGLFALKDKQIKINHTVELNKYSIATIGDSAPEQALKRLGILEKNFQRSSDPILNLQKLQRNRVDLMAHPIQSVSYMMFDKKIQPDDFEVVYDFNKHGLHFAFTPDFSDDEIKKFQNALDHFMQTKAYLELRRTYGIDKFETAAGP